MQLFIFNLFFSQHYNLATASPPSPPSPLHTHTYPTYPPPPDLLLLHFPSEQSRPLSNINQIQHDKIQQD